MHPGQVKKVEGGSIIHYEIGEKIGQGGFAIVYKAVRKSDGEIVAIKKITKRTDYGERERHFMEMNRSTGRFVPLLDAFYHEKMLYLVMPYYPLGSLSGYIKRNRKLSQYTAAFIIRQVANALLELHTIHVGHRDVTTGNMLISKIEEDKVYVHLSDFGLARIMRENKTKYTVVGTPGYMAPHIANHEAYGLECDIYALGSVFYAMLTGFDPPRTTEDQSRETMKTMVAQVRGAACNDAADMLEKMLSRKNPLPLKEIVFQPFMKILKPTDGNSLILTAGTSREPGKKRSTSKECRHRITDAEGRCERCRVLVYDRDNPEKENRPRTHKSAYRDSAFASGDDNPVPSRSNDRPNRPLKRSTSANCIDRQPTTNDRNDNTPAANAPWPVPSFSHFVPFTLRNEKKGRFILSTNECIVAEHVTPQGFVNFVMKIKVSSGNQLIEIYQPRYNDIRLPDENDPLVPVHHNYEKQCKLIYDLNFPELGFYNIVVKSISIISGRVAQIDYVNIFDVHHLQAKLMYNGDFRLLFPNRRIFVLPRNASTPKCMGATVELPMNDEERHYYHRALGLLKDMHEVFQRYYGKDYRQQTIVGQKARTTVAGGDAVGTVAPSDNFGTATFASRPRNTVASAPAESIRRTRSRDRR